MQIPTEEALAITLRRLAFPSRLSDLSLIFGYHTTDISRVFNAMIKVLYDRYGRVMELNYNQFSPANLERFSSAIHANGKYCNLTFQKIEDITGTYYSCIQDQFIQIALDSLIAHS